MPCRTSRKGHVPSGFDETQLHKVEETEHGILVRGARVLATLAPFADELAVYPSQPMPDAARGTRCRSASGWTRQG